MDRRYKAYFPASDALANLASVLERAIAFWNFVLYKHWRAGKENDSA